MIDMSNKGDNVLLLMILSNSLMYVSLNNALSFTKLKYSLTHALYGGLTSTLSRVKNSDPKTS